MQHCIPRSQANQSNQWMRTCCIWRGSREMRHKVKVCWWNTIKQIIDVYTILYFGTYCVYCALRSLPIMVIISIFSSPICKCCCPKVEGNVFNREGSMCALLQYISGEITLWWFLLVQPFIDQQKELALQYRAELESYNASLSKMDKEAHLEEFRRNKLKRQKRIQKKV